MSSTSEIGTKGMARSEREVQILDAAADEFTGLGFDGASMLAIAERAGISKALIYQYFGSKDSLYIACLHRVAEDLITRIEAEMASEDESLALPLGVLQAIFESLAPRRAVWRLLYDPSLPSTGPVSEALHGYRGRIAALAALGTTRFLHAREDRDDLDASALSHVWTSTVHALVTWWIEHPEQSAHDMTQRCHRILDAIARL